MKIVLINPPTLNAVKTNESFFTMNTVNLFPPITLMYLSAMLKKFGNYQIKIIDADVETKNYEQIAEEVKNETPDIVGITGYTMVFYDCLETIKSIKKCLPSVKIFVGGNVTKYFPKETIEHPEIDFVFLGDAEYSFPQLVNILEKNEDVDKVSGIMYKKGGQIITTGPPNVIENLDQIPFPDLDSVDLKKYYFSMGDSKPLAVIIGSRGCPYPCGFCQSSKTKYRMRSINSLLEEIEYYLKIGIEEFTFYDDTFNITAQRVIDFSKEILKRGHRIKWSFRGRIDNVSEEMFRIAKESGLNLMSYGVEDATDEGLKHIQRMQTLEQVYKGTALAKKYEIPININFIIGLPAHKTKEDALRVIKFAKKLKPDYCQLSIFIPHVGTRFYNEGVERGIINKDFWPNYIKNPTKEARIPFWEEHLKEEELNDLIRKAHIYFYFDPRYIFQTILNVKSLKDFFLKAKVGFSLFKIFLLKRFLIKKVYN